MSINTTAYENLDEWYRENLAPIFKEINVILAQQGDQNDADILFGHWWAIFLKNSMALVELLPGRNYSYQMNMTIRLLMEMATDIEFMNKNRGNISRHKYRFDKISRKAKRLNGMTYEQLAKEGKNFHLFRYDGEERGEEVETTERVREAYNPKDYSFYEYLSCFTHFNYLGMMYDLNLSQPNKISESLQERMYFLQFYPVIFEKVIHSIGDLCNIDDLRNYDCGKIRKVLAKLALRCRYDYARAITPNSR